MKQGFEIDIASVRRTKFQMIIWFSTTATLLVIILSSLIIRQTNNILKIKVSELEKELNIQACANMDNHIYQVENAVEYLRIMTENLNLHISQNDISRAEKEKNLQEVSSFLKNFSFIRNYSDMAVIYSDGYFAGKLSNTTYNPELLYTHINSKLQDRIYSKIWSSGDFGNFEKIYFAKKISQNALFLCSLETKKLADFISAPNTMNMETILVNPENQIIYSNTTDDIGNEIPEGLINVGNNNSKLYIFDKSMIAMSTCSNGWRLFTTASINEVLKERKNLITYVIILAVFAITAILIFCIIFSLKLSIPIERLIDSLHNQATKDKLTKLSNEITFEKRSAETIAQHQDKNYGIFFLDIDHFTTLIETEGRSECDKIIFDLSNCIRKTFPKDSIIGRIGTDRFGVCTEVSKNPDDMNSVQSFCEILQQELFTRFQGNFELTLSIGVSLYPDHGKSFKVLLDMSERAMNTVKKNSRNNWRIFNPITDIQSFQKQ